ncbi:Uncharacterised protein [Mycoplasmopsis californica]|uniref:Lipoprotein n=1 Tax=Mycoplasmopsis equigenitalium TaxID=114883 RepID=A0ABY5J4B0_9BACT|nr:hypothetical protein [Mycoplasmopsis equigenitalium]UUD36790.1 hypothetical protein NPA09_02735 [Mycoplasmopsis equigenitalium]VEU69912.1 Uncharacterised protein [Mycoplasmopsis californica]
MRKSKLIWIISPIILLPFVTSCSSKFVAKDIYIIEKNESNPNYNKPMISTGEFAYRDSLHDSLTGNYLMRYKYIGTSKYDSLNRYFSSVSAKYLTFGLVKKINIYDGTNTFEFNADDDKQWSDVDPVEKHLIKKDSTAGYLNSTYKLDSKNDNSINSKKFLESLKIAKRIDFVLKDNLYYFDYLGNKTNKKILGTHFYNSLEASKLTNKQLNYLKLVGFKNSILDKKNFNATSFSFELENVTNPEMFLNELINNKAFSAIFQQKNKKNIELSEILYAGSYAMKTNDLNRIEYVSINNDSKIKKVIIKYNSAGEIDLQTHRIHLLNAYEQGLITSQKINIFDNFQQQDLLYKNDAGTHKLNIIKTQNDQSKILLFSDNPNFKNATFNNNYAVMMYGKNYQNHIDYDNFYNKTGLIFRNNITQIINKFTLTYTYNKTQYYDNFINPEALISNNKNSNYTNIKSAIAHIDKNKLLIFENEKTIQDEEYFSEENRKHYYSEGAVKDIYAQFKSQKYEEIKKSINNLLNHVFTSNKWNDSQIIKFDIPLLQSIDQKYISILNELLNDIDQRMKINVKVEKNPENLVKMGYNLFNSNDKNTISYLSSLLTSKQNNLFLNLLHLDNEINKNFNHLNTFKEYLFKKLNLPDTGPTGLEQLNIDEIFAQISAKNKAKEISILMESTVIAFHNENSYYDIILLINDIKNSYAAPYRIDHQINLELFNYELIQPYLLKPTRDDELVYFEDIKIL